MKLSDGWRTPANAGDPDWDDRVAIAERDVTLDDMIELFGENGRAAWPAIEKARAEGGEAVIVVRGREEWFAAEKTGPDSDDVLVVRSQKEDS